MKRLLLAGLIALYFTSCGSIDHYSLKVLKAHNSVVMILGSHGGRGSAVHIGNGQFMSAWHVCGSTDTELMYVYNGELYEMSLKGYSEKWDLMLLEAEVAPGLTSTPVAKNGPKIGNKAYSIGFHFGEEILHMITEGIISNLYYGLDSNHHYIVYSASMNSGCSGGALLNSDFELIGINQLIMTMSGGWNGVSLSTSFENLLEFLDIVNI